MEIRLTVNLRQHQRLVFDQEKRFQVLVWHRRAGKTFYVVARQVMRALATSRNDHRAFYLASTFKAAKGISWDYLKAFTRDIPGTKINESELRVDLWNGARLQLLGAENIDAIRGRYADDLAIDETAMIPGSSYNLVLSPMLADRMGCLTAIGTPMGESNLLFELFDYAQGSGDPDWQWSHLKWSDTLVIPQAEIDRMRRTMRPSEFDQELECSWTAAIRGAYFAAELSKLREAGRIRPLAYERTSPVFMAVDLGIGDTMVAIAFQRTGADWRVLDARGYEGTDLPAMVRDWRARPFPIDQVILPHDGRVRELGTGLTRQEVMEKLGCRTLLCPNVGLHEGISQVNDAISQMWLDTDGTKMLREAMSGYRSEFDEVRQVHSVKPLHSWHSHWCDALRYAVVGWPGQSGLDRFQDNRAMMAEFNRGVF